MKQFVVLSLGDFIRKVTAYMDETCLWCSFEFNRLELNGREYMFTPQQLDNVMDILGGVFYRNYGGWNVAFEFYPNNTYADKMFFAPACQNGFIGLLAVE